VDGRLHEYAPGAKVAVCGYCRVQSRKLARGLLESSAPSKLAVRSSSSQTKL
jgi:hypothetical protein